MPVKIRLQRHGRAKAPFYHIVIADARAPRDGRFIEKIGTYNPLTKPATITIDRDKAYEWLTKGAQPTDTVRAILRFKGVMFKKHLMRGVSKGALTVEQADTKYNEFVEIKENKVSSRAAETKIEKEAHRVAVFGVAKAPKKKEEPIVEAPVVEEIAPVVEAVVEAPVVVEVAAPVVVEEVEAPAAVEVVEEVAVVEAVVEAPAAVEVVEEVAPVMEAVVEAPVVVEETAPVAEAKADDLTVIEGIGPKIGEMIVAAGITTYAQLADTATEKLQEILDGGGSRYAIHKPGTWAEQAALLRDGKMEEFKALCDELDGGVRVAKD